MNYGCMYRSLPNVTPVSQWADVTLRPFARIRTWNGSFVDSSDLHFTTNGCVLEMRRNTYAVVTIHLHSLQQFKAALVCVESKTRLPHPHPQTTFTDLCDIVIGQLFGGTIQEGFTLDFQALGFLSLIPLSALLLLRALRHGASAGNPTRDSPVPRVRVSTSTTEACHYPFGARIFLSRVPYGMVANPTDLMRHLKHSQKSSSSMCSVFFGSLMIIPVGHVQPRVACFSQQEIVCLELMVRPEGVEPSIPKALVSKTSVYTSSTTDAWQPAQAHTRIGPQSSSQHGCSVSPLCDVSGALHVYFAFECRVGFEPTNNCFAGSPLTARASTRSPLVGVLARFGEDKCTSLPVRMGPCRLSTPRGPGGPERTTGLEPATSTLAR